MLRLNTVSLEKNVVAARGALEDIVCNVPVNMGENARNRMPHNLELCLGAASRAFKYQSREIVLFWDRNFHIIFHLLT